MSFAPPSRPVPLRVSLAFTAIALASIALTSFLNFAKFESNLDALEHARIDAVLGDLRSTLDTGLNLGLPLRQLGNAQSAIDAQRLTDRDILSITLFDETGEWAFHAGQALPGGSLPPEWRPAARSWRLLTSDAQIVGLRLSSVIGTEAGGMVIRYTRTRRDRVLREVRDALSQAGAITALLCALASVLVFGMLQREAS